MYVCMCVCVCMYVYVHTYTHTYRYGYTYEPAVGLGLLSPKPDPWAPPTPLSRAFRQSTCHVLDVCVRVSLCVYIFTFVFVTYIYTDTCASTTTRHAHMHTHIRCIHGCTTRLIHVYYRPERGRHQNDAAINGGVRHRFWQRLHSRHALVAYVMVYYR